MLSSRPQLALLLLLAWGCLTGGLLWVPGPRPQRDSLSDFSWRGWLSNIHASKLQHNNLSHFKKKHHRVFLCNSLRKLKISRDQRLGSQNPDHKPRDPDQSSNIFCLDSLWPYTSHPLYWFQPGVTGGSQKIQQQNHHRSKPIPQNGIIRGAFNKVPDLFRTSIWNCRRILKIQYVIAMMRWLTNSYDFSFK